MISLLSHPKRKFSLFSTCFNTFFKKNSYKKYQDIEAIKHNDENIFLEIVLKHVENSDGFR